MQVHSDKKTRNGKIGVYSNSCNFIGLQGKHHGGSGKNLASIEIFLLLWDGLGWHKPVL